MADDCDVQQTHYEFVIGPGATPNLAEALMDVARAHGARLVSIGAADYIVRVSFDRELPQSEIVQRLAERLQGKHISVNKHPGAVG